MHTIIRRLARPALTALAVGTLLFAGFSHARPSSAFAEWSFDDPIVSIGGNLLDIRVGQPLLNVLSARSTTLTVVIPSNVSGSVVVNNISAFPMTTTISRTAKAWSGSGPIPVTVTANVTSAVTYSTQLTATPLLNLTTPLAPAVSTTGTTNVPFSLALTLGK